MNVQVTSRIFVFLLFLSCGYLVRVSDCLSVTTKYGENSVMFKCVIFPYTGSQKWFVDSASMTVCLVFSCTVNSSKPARYYFTDDLTSGIFTFEIDPIESTDYERDITCFDGTNETQVTFERGESSSSSGDGNNIGETIGIPAGGSIAGVCCICLGCGAIVFVLKRKRKREREFYLLNVGQSSIRVRWKMCKKDRSAIYYKLTCSEINGHNEISVTPYDNKMNFIPEFQITGLELSTSYKLNLICYVKSEMPDTDGNVYKKYRTINVTTFGQGQSDQKRKFHMLNVGQKSIKVCWPTIEKKDEDSKQEYILIYSEKGIDKSFSFDNNGKEMMRHIITDLKPSTSYKINLQVSCQVDSKNVIKKFEQLDVKTYGISAAPKKDFYEINVGQTSINVRWKLCKDGESPKMYHLTFETVVSIPIRDLKEDGHGDFMEYTISGLTASTMYRFGLKCYDKPDEYWACQSSRVLKTYDTLEVETLGEQAVELKQIHPLSIGQTSMTLRFNLNVGMTPQKKYALNYSGNGVECTRRLKKKGKDFIRFTITDLIPSTLYTLDLRCSDVLITYKPLEIETKGNTADQPVPEKELYVISVGQTMILIRWKLFKEGDTKKKYELTYYWDDRNKSIFWTDNIMDNYTEYLITGLQESTLYQIKLTCSEESDASDVSDEDKSDEVLKKYRSLDVRTNDPPDDRGLFTSKLTETNMKVQWTKCKDDRTNKYILSYIKDGKTNDIQIDADKDDLNYLVDGLQPLTWYELNLRSCDKSFKLLKVYKPLYKRTSVIGDAPKKEFYETNVDHTSITVKWKLCKDGKSSKAYYLTCNEITNICPVKEYRNREFMEYTISGLTQSPLYKLTLKCYHKSEKSGECLKAESGRLLKTYKSLQVTAFERARNDEFSVLEVTTTSIKVCWEICKSDTPKKKYLLSYFENGSTYDECIYGKGGTLCLEHTFIGMTPSALHVLNLRCLDESNKLLKVYKTLYQRTNDSPQETEFWTSEVTDQSIKVHWKKCNCGPPNKKYVLSYFTDGKTIDRPLEGIQDDTLEDLNQSTLYELILRCTDQSGKLLKVYKPIYKRTKGIAGHASQNVAEEIFDIPETAEIDGFYTKTITHECIEGSWKKYKSKSSSEKNYVLSYFKHGKTFDKLYEGKTFKKSSIFSISKLEPATLYELNLRCLNESNKLVKVYQPLYKRTNAKKHEEANNGESVIEID